MTKYYAVTAGELLFPTTDGAYKMECCDCGLVHDMYFSAFRVSRTYKDGTFDGRFLKGSKYKVALIADRDNRSTAAKRRHKWPKA